MSTAVPPPDNTRSGFGGSDPEITRTDVRRPEMGTRPTGATAPGAGVSGYDRSAVIARQKEEFGGMKFGATFFGWLAAAGAGVLLTALLAAAGAGIGLSANVDPDSVVRGNAGTIGLISAIVLLVVILIAYFCGGYVAGRMARFSGLKQGFGVWLWAIIAAAVVAALGAITGNQLDASRYLNGAPQIPVTREALTTTGILAAVAVAVVALIGALLGGLAGMRYHRRIDRAGDDL